MARFVFNNLRYHLIFGKHSNNHSFFFSWIVFGGVFVFVGYLVFGGGACFCFFFFFLSCFSIASTILKRRSQMTAANFGVLVSFNIYRTISLVSSSHGCSNNISETYSAVSSSVYLAIVEYTCVNIPASVFGWFLVLHGVPVVGGDFVVGGLVFGGVAYFFLFVFLFVFG